MRKIMLGLLVLGTVLGLGTVTTERAEGATITGLSVQLFCSRWGYTQHTITFDRDNTGNGEEAWEIHVTDGAGKQVYFSSHTDAVGTSIVNSGPTTVEIDDPDYNPLTFRWVSLAGNGLDEQVVYETTGECAGLPTYSGGAATQPGCDMFALPDTAVVGQFTRDTVLEWAPGQATDITVEAGKTAWVLSTNNAGTHYRISIGCARAWVPVGNMGPNHDEVWQGAPLPANSNNP